MTNTPRAIYFCEIVHVTPPIIVTPFLFSFICYVGMHLLSCCDHSRDGTLVIKQGLPCALCSYLHFDAALI